MIKTRFQCLLYTWNCLNTTVTVKCSQIACLMKIIGNHLKLLHFIYDQYQHNWSVLKNILSGIQYILNIPSCCVLMLLVEYTGKWRSLFGVFEITSTKLSCLGGSKNISRWTIGEQTCILTQKLTFGRKGSAARFDLPVN